MSLIIHERPRKSRKRENSRMGRLRTILSELCPAGTPIETDKVRVPLLHLGYSPVEIGLVRRQLGIVSRHNEGSTSWTWTRLPEGQSPEVVTPEATEQITPDVIPDQKPDIRAAIRRIVDAVGELHEALVSIESCIEE